MSDIVKISNQRWVYIYSNLSKKDKNKLKRYFSSIYPREYISRLVAALDANIKSGN